jgi:AAA+ superfamily predicted ATPase
VPDKPVEGNTYSRNGDESKQSGEQGSFKEQLRRAYGSARGRSSSARGSEEFPPVKLPEWFMEKHVSLLGLRPMLSVDRGIGLQQGISRNDIQVIRSSQGSVRIENVEHLLRRVNDLSGDALREIWSFIENDGRLTKDVISEFHELSNSILASRPPERTSDYSTGTRLKRSISDIHSEGGLDGSRGSNEARRNARLEQVARVELEATVRSEIAARAPKNTPARRLDRPVTLMAILNNKSQTVAQSIVDDLATELMADVVHINASNIARIVGDYLGQTQYWARDSISMLGYAAAEINGRAAPRADLASEHEDAAGLIISLPPRLSSIMSKKDGLIFGGMNDERWEDLKVNQVLEELVGAADTKRRAVFPRSKKRDLIIHIHDYLEMSSLADGILKKIRSIVGRMWHNGRSVIVLGSTSSHMQDSSQWKSQLMEMNKEGQHVIPFLVDESPDNESWEEEEMVQENLDNLTSMIRAVAGDASDVSCDFKTPSDSSDRTTSTFEDYIYDIHWIYRLASLMLGTYTSRPLKLDRKMLNEALETVAYKNLLWRSVYHSLRPPYYSPVFLPGSSSISSSSSTPSRFNSKDYPTDRDALFKDLDTHEKKMVSGFIDAEEIRTKFDDIVVPEATKESLIALTSLSLVRPDAFTYGVLKRERIPGCLLYGPPGTGKTLLAKAVAKESGACMIEVSAASINDMYVGESEKNVRALFSAARKLSPAVIFLDEADALLGSRQYGRSRAVHRETITQFLREWDGMTDMNAFIMVATNRPFDLDEAVLRRLPRKLLVDLPLQAEREAILRIVLRDEILHESVSLGRLAEQTDLYSGSDLKNLCVSAAMQAVREEMRAARLANATASDADIKDGGFPERRVLTLAHFDRALQDISASISEDMESLKAIRKFDEQYGDSGRRRRKSRQMGFEVVSSHVGTEDVRVRKVVNGHGSRDDRQLLEEAGLRQA